MKKNALVTGGAGFIGSHLVDALVKDEYQVTVIDDFSGGKRKNLSKHINNPKVTVYEQSICEDLSRLFEKEKPNVIFHLAAIPRVQFSIKYPRKTHEANVNGTVNLLEACRQFNVKRFVFSSSSSVYGNQDAMPLTENMTPNPMSPYALHKLIGEEYCQVYKKIYGLEPVMLRYFNVFGPRQDPRGDYACLIPKFIKLISGDTQPTINGDGEQTRDFTCVADVVAANIAAAKTTNERCFGEAFNVGASNNKSVNKVADEIIKLMESSIEPIHGPKVIEPKNTLADISKIKKSLNWQPTTPFEEGLRQTYEFFQAKK